MSLLNDIYWISSPLAIDQRNNFLSDPNSKRTRLAKPIIGRYVDPKNEIHVFHHLEHWTFDIGGRCYELSPEVKRKLNMLEKMTHAIQPHSVDSKEWWDLRRSKQINPKWRRIGRTSKTHDEIMAEVKFIWTNFNHDKYGCFTQNCQNFALILFERVANPIPEHVQQHWDKMPDPIGFHLAGGAQLALAGEAGSTAGTAAAGSGHAAAGHIALGAGHVALGASHVAVGAKVAKVGVAVAYAHPVTAVAVTGGLAYLALKGKRGKGWNEQQKTADDATYFDLLEQENEQFKQADGPEDVLAQGKQTDEKVDEELIEQLRRDVLAQAKLPGEKIDNELAEQLKLGSISTKSGTMAEGHGDVPALPPRKGGEEIGEERAKQQQLGSVTTIPGIIAGKNENAPALPPRKGRRPQRELCN